MSNRLELTRALSELKRNPEQFNAVRETRHCVVVAGPGSGKTKTLTTAMARSLAEDVTEPRGVACITYNNECAIELEKRLARLGISAADRCFIGTVHSFALTQVIGPYARCLEDHRLPKSYLVGTATECRSAVEAAHDIIGGSGNPHDRWRFAEEKRRRDVDRMQPAWRGRNPELADFIEAYESELRRMGLIDFDDMPLIAYRMIKAHRWIRDAIRARFPILFVDEYQDLGHALHELVRLLCFSGGIRLFAVGDVDQSIYSFSGANPELLQSLIDEGDVATFRLRFNYRSGARIIRASLGALGEERDYQGLEGAPDGELKFAQVNGDHRAQAQHIARVLVPELLERGIKQEEIAVLYRAAWLGDILAEALDGVGVPFVRSDTNALVKRSSRLARFIEACAVWVTGGWRTADPPYSRLLAQAVNLVYGGFAKDLEEEELSRNLIVFLQSGIGRGDTTHDWLSRLYAELIMPWQSMARNSHQEWEICTEMIAKTDPSRDCDIPLGDFAGCVEGAGRITLSTLHSAKGREFDAVIMFAMNAYDIPSRRDFETDRKLSEARRLFYVGVTRARKELCLVFQRGHHSPWVAELYKRSQIA